MNTCNMLTTIAQRNSGSPTLTTVAAKTNQLILIGYRTHKPAPLHEGAWLVQVFNITSSDDTASPPTEKRPS